MSNSVKIDGSVVVGNAVGCDPCGGAGTKVVTLTGDCGASKVYQCVVSTDGFCALSSPTLFVDIGILSGLSVIELIVLKTTGGAFEVRVDATVASVLMDNAVPTPSFVGGETLIMAVDLQPAVTTTFTSAATTAQLVANEINGAFTLLGQSAPARVDATSGKVAIESVNTGIDALVDIQSGTGLVALGLTAGQTTGGGADTDVQGLWLQQFPPSPNAPARIQIRGVGSIEVLAAGIPV